MLHPPSLDGPTNTNPIETSFANRLVAKKTLNKNAIVFFIDSFELRLVGKVGFEPTKILIARFTVWCTSPSVPLTRKKGSAG